MSEEKIGSEENGFVMSDGGDQNIDESQMPKINFSTFVFSLNSSALVHLGAISAPGSDEKIMDLPLAKQTIDIIGILEEKTKGNLTTEEGNMLKNILHDLRMMYVRAKEK